MTAKWQLGHWSMLIVQTSTYYLPENSSTSVFIKVIYKRTDIKIIRLSGLQLEWIVKLSTKSTQEST